MGSATDEARHHERERSERLPAMSASPAIAANATPKWKIAQRVLPLSERDVVLAPIDAEKLHPLKTFALVQHAVGKKPEPATLVPVAAPRVRISTARESVKALVEANPLGGTTEVVALEEGELDPLGALAMGVPLEETAAPLESKTGARVLSQRSLSNAGGCDGSGTLKQLWTVHKDRVLAKLSDETFTIKASMLETNDIENELSYSSTSEYQRREDDVPVTTAADGTHVIRKSRARLEQLERRQSSTSSASNSRAKEGSTVEITQREYVTRIKQMQADLVKAWEQNMKVQALRIAIKCVKQLSDTSSAPQLYPCAFVLVSDILDVFGQLVFDRIKARASEDENGQPLPTPLGEKFTSDEVNIHAKETCRNWFYKTACIRELLPRIYIEIALLKSYRFLGDGEFPQIVARLSNMIKGVGEPMVALYTRLYLALASTELVDPSEKTAVLSGLFDYFFAFQQYQDQRKLVRFVKDQNLTHDDYSALHSPAVEWLMKCAAQGASDDVFEALLEQYKEYSDNSMVLKHLCESFGGRSCASNPMQMLQLMRTASSSQFSKCHLYSVLAVQLSNSPSIGLGSKDTKLRFLNEAWSSITAQENIEMYMECAAAYMRLIVAHYTDREAMILLKDVMRHLNSATPEELTPKVYNLLGAFIENVVYGAQKHVDFFKRLIPSGEFLSLMGMFRREASVSVAKKVLQAFVNTQETSSTKNNNFGSLRLQVVGPEAAVAHTLFVICCRVHDALDSLSTASERNDATKDIVAFISRLGYAKQHSQSSNITIGTTRALVSDSELQEEEEALLMMYIDCRSAFYKLEPIKGFLTKFVIALAMRVRDRMLATSRDKNAPRVEDRRRDFIKSCLAYAHITIPSITNAFSRLKLLVLSSHAALVNGCLPQMEAFMRSAIVVIADLDYAEAVSGVDLLSSERGGYAGETGSTRDLVDESCDPVVRVVNNLVSVATYAPSLMDDEPFYFVEALRRALFERMMWESPAAGVPDRVRRAATTSRISILVSFVQLYAMWGQTRIPARLNGVDSNDVMYGGDEVFQQRTQLLFSTTVEQAVRDVEALETSSTSSSWDAAASQVELLSGLIVTVYPYLRFDEDAPNEGADADPASGSLSTEATPRRAKRSRSGAVLLRKCVMFVSEKLKVVLDIAQQQEQETRARKAETLRTQFSAIVVSLRNYVERQQKKRAPLYSSTGRQALDALEHTLSSLVTAV